MGTSSLLLKIPLLDIVFWLGKYNLSTSITSVRYSLFNSWDSTDKEDCTKRSAIYCIGHDVYLPSFTLMDIGNRWSHVCEQVLSPGGKSYVLLFRTCHYIRGLKLQDLCCMCLFVWRFASCCKSLLVSLLVWIDVESSFRALHACFQTPSRLPQLGSTCL